MNFHRGQQPLWSHGNEFPSKGVATNHRSLLANGKFSAIKVKEDPRKFVHLVVSKYNHQILEVKLLMLQKSVAPVDMENLPNCLAEVKTHTTVDGSKKSGDHQLI